jgi:hypothetical protein
MRKVEGLGTSVEAQAATVAQAALGRTQFTRQSFPVPALVDGQKHPQPQAQGVEGRWTEPALEALGKVRSPGGEVEQAQHQIEFVQSG